MGKTWAHFRVNFGRAYQELVESTQTAQTEVFQGNSAEVQQDTIDAIDNFVNATIVDRYSMESLTQTVSYLMEELFKTQENIVADLTALAESNKKIRDRTKPSNRVSVSYMHYFHTHRPTSSHPSF